MPKSRINIIKKHITYGNVEKVKLITEASLKTHKEVFNRITELAQLALTKNQSEIFEYFAKYIDEEDKIQFLISMIIDPVSFNLFHIILNNIPDVHLSDKYDRTPISCALFGYYQNFNNSSDSEEYNASIRELYKNIIIELLKRGDSSYGWEEWRPVIAREDIDLLKIARTYSHCDFSYSMLEYAVMRGKYNSIEYLLQYVEVNKKNEDGMTLLAIARSCEPLNSDIIDLLIENYLYKR